MKLYSLISVYEDTVYEDTKANHITINEVENMLQGYLPGKIHGVRFSKAFPKASLTDLSKKPLKEFPKVNAERFLTELMKGVRE